MKLLTLLVIFAASLPLVGVKAESGEAPWRSTLYPADWTPGFTDAEGRFLHDFSYAGYHHGERSLPDISGPIINAALPPYDADRTGQRDATAPIQSALDAAGKMGGAVVLLPAGIYRVAPPPGASAALKIQGDRVILRGEGPEKTFLFNDAVQMREKNVILVQAENPADWHAEGGGIPSSQVTRDVANRDREVGVAEPERFQTGDLVVLRSDLTQRFIDSVEMMGKWEPAGASSRNRTLLFCRRVVAVDLARKALTFDVPVRYPVLMADGARVVKIPGHTISESALENFSIGMKQHPGAEFEDRDFSKQGTAAFDVHAATAIVFVNAENCWMRGINSYAPDGNSPSIHLLSNGVRLHRSRLVTVEGCDFRSPQYLGEGGNGYMYTLLGQENLLRRCVAENGRHNFDFATMAASGNVITECTTRNGRLPSDFHMFLSMANLLDNVTCDSDMLEARRLRPWGGTPMHGVTTTQSVFWNVNGLRYAPYAKHIVDSHQIVLGYVIGTRGPASAVNSDNFVEGAGHGETLDPSSLYADQLKRRIAK